MKEDYNELKVRAGHRGERRHFMYERKEELIHTEFQVMIG